METENYRKDSKGRLVPVGSIKEVDLMRDDLVTSLIADANDMKALLIDKKKAWLADVMAFVDLSLEKYDVKLGGNKGNITLASFDGQRKIVLAIAENIAFDERLEAAKILIDECVSEWVADSNQEIKSLIDSAFYSNNNNLNTRAILGLRRMKIDHPKWLQAMEAISDAVVIHGSKEYLRFYYKGNDGKNEQIALDIAKV